MKQTHCESLYLEILDPGEQRAYLIRVERGENGPVVEGPFANAEPQIRRDRGRWLVGMKGVKLGSRLATDFQNVLEPRCGHERSARKLPFQQRVGGNRCPMHDPIDGAGAQRCDPLQHRPGRILRVGWELIYADRP